MGKFTAFNVSLFNGQIYIHPHTVEDSRNAFFPGAASVPEFEAHIDHLINELVSLKPIGAEILRQELAKPLFSGND
jgi:hypothetical protein